MSRILSRCLAAVSLIALQLFSCLQVAHAQEAYAGVWRAGTDGHYLWVGQNWADFEAKWKELSDKNLRLVDLDTYMDGNTRKYAGVWRAGNDAHYLWAGVDWNSFNAKWTELAKQNLRLIDIETYVENGQRKYTGVWRAGSDAHYLWAGVDWNSFNAKWEELSKQNLRLVDFVTYTEGSARKYIGVWRAGSDAHYLWVGVDWNSFNAKWQELAKQNLRLTVFKTWMEGSQRRYAGVWRGGSDGYFLWAGVDWENFNAKWHEMSGQGQRLINVVSYEGCKAACANQVVAAGAYNYTISGDTTTYHWPVDLDGSAKYARLSAISGTDQPFTLPFASTSVKRWNGWLYEPGNWHHAVDYAVDLAQTFEIRAAAAGKVIFVGWDNWSGNTVVLSHKVGNVDDAYRTIYMHMRNGPANDCGLAWSRTIADNGIAADKRNTYKGHLNATGCKEAAASRSPTSAAWGTSSQTIAVAVNQTVTAGQKLGWAGDTGPGGNGGGNANTNTHLHIFFTRKDPADNNYYFIDPYGIYGIPSCYPAGNTDTPSGACVRYPVAWKGGHPQYP